MTREMDLHHMISRQSVWPLCQEPSRMRPRNFGSVVCVNALA